MSISCWKAIKSPQTIPSPTLLKTFDVHSHRPHGIIQTFPICVGGKVVNIEVEIVDANLDYNILLGRNWIYEMDAIVSSLFCILCFPHEGRNVTIDQMDYSPGESNASSESIVPLVNNLKHPIENVGVGMYSSLMGTFDFLAPVTRINAISSSTTPSRREFFRTHYFLDPWSLPRKDVVGKIIRMGRVM